MTVRTAFLALLLLLAPCVAHADPVTAFFAGLGMTSATTAAVAMALQPLAFAVGAFFTTALGSLILNIGVGLLMRPSAPGIDALRVTSRREDSPRWQLAGTVCAGGETGIFGEHDAEGNFWYICAHGDAELVGAPAYLLDGIAVTVSDGTDGFLAGEVLTDDFCLRDNKKKYEGSGTRYPYVRLWTVTPDAANEYGAPPAEFAAAFPDLPADFYLAGVCYTVVRCAAIGRRNYQNIWHWRGGFGLGEPAVSLIGDFNRMYDPRDVAQDVNDPATWESGGSNPALIWAWWRTTGRGRNRPISEINWDLVAVAADACDETVLDRSAVSIPRYRCGVAFPDSRPRHECEAEILKTMAAFVAYDDAGRAYPVAGVYEAADLTFYGSRDVLDYQTQIVDDGEQPVHGVIVEYISPDHGWTKQPCAPWINTTYYDGSSEPLYQTISILGCQNHNQAVRLAKDHGLTIGAAKKAALNVGLKGELAKGRRSINLDLDADFSGEFKIATPVENAADGQSFGFAIVPMSSLQYDLAPGEEGEPPQSSPVLDVDDALEAAADVVVSAVLVGTSSGDAVRLEATFDAPARVDRDFAFRFTLQGSGIYEDMTVDMDALRAWSSIVEAGAVYEVQWQTITAGGRASDWSTAVAITASVAPISFELLTEPAPDGVSRSVSGLPDGTQLVMGDGEWWRRVSNGKIASASDYIALFDSAEYQIEQVDKTRAQVLTLTRASTATYIDASGALQVAAVDAVRIDHALGTPTLLIEPSRTNDLLRSAELENAYWTKLRATITANAVTAPDGTLTADTLTDDTATGTHQIYRNAYAGWVSGQVYGLSVFARAGTLDEVALQLGASGSVFPTGANWRAVFDLSTGTILSAGANILALDPEALGSGWYRLGIIGTAQATAAESCNLAFLCSGGVPSYTGTGTGTVHLWGAQLEGDGVSSHIPTAAAAVTRAADVATMNGITATLDLALTYGDGTTGAIAGAPVSPSYWPTLAQTRLRRLVGAA